jgi:hypothetical protein
MSLNQVNCWNPSNFKNVDLIYEQYINYLKLKQGKYKIGELLYKHRINPGHAGGTYEDPDNVISITYQEHVLAHFYRYLSYGEMGDKIAYTCMTGLTEDVARTIAIYGGTLSGRANVDSGRLKKLNDHITQHNPQQRVTAGKLGGKARIEKQKLQKIQAFDPNHIFQKHGNLKRWGIVINGKRIPYEKLSSDFINYHLAYGKQTSYLSY